MADEDTIQLKIETKLIESVRAANPDYKNINATIITKLALMEFASYFRNKKVEPKETKEAPE